MSASDATAAARRARPLLAAVGLALGIAALLLLAAGPTGYRLGIVDLGTALGLLPRVGAYAGLAGTAISLLAVAVSLRAGRRGWAAVAILGLLAGTAAAYVPWAYRESVAGAAHLNDITTDTENPPAFETLARLRDAARAVPSTYGGPQYAAQQKQAYPDIQPLRLGVSPADAFARVLDQVRREGWTVVAIDPARGRIEASAQTRWYGLIDDVVLRVGADGAGSRVDMRSKSRIGSGDRGVNAARIREFLRALKSSMS